MQESVLTGYRLAPQQRRLWALLRQEWNGAYQTKCAVTIKGQLESRHLKTAAENVIARHEILRTTFQCLPGMTIPMQVIEETCSVSWQEDDLSGLGEQAFLIEAFFHATSHSIDFERGPFLYIHLIKRAKNDYVLIVRLPAICADSVSLSNLVGEISRSYAAVLCGEELDSNVAQYADLAEWQNELIESEETGAGREHWQNRNPLGAPILQLAFEGIPTSGAAFEPRLEELVIAPPLTARIESFAHSAGIPIAQILLACWHILLWRHTGQSEIEVGTLFDGRDETEIEGALGLFAKYLPVTCRLEEGLKFSELIEKIDQSFVTALDWQEYFSWEHLVEPSASLLRAPFFPFCFESEVPPASFSAGKLLFTIYKQYSCIDRFKIKLSYARRADGLVVEFHYDSELFQPADIRCLIEQYQSLLESLIANPAAKINELKMVSEAERQLRLLENNSAQVEWPQDKFVHELFLEQVNRRPEAVAVICEDEQLSYRELNERATRLSHHLRGLGVGPEVVVGLYLERSLDLIVSLLAALKSGGAYLPLDPSYPPGRLSYMLEDSAVTALLTQKRLGSRLPPMKQAQVIYVDALEGLTSQIPAPDHTTMLSPDNLAYVIYTSGSTGWPKGVMVGHRGLVNYTQYICRRLGLMEEGGGESLQFATVSTITADLGNTCIYPSLVSGGCLHILSYEVATDGGRFEEYLRKNPIDVLKIVPSHLGALLGSRPKEVRMLPYRYLILGGEALSDELMGRIREREEGCEVINHYGPTETTIGSLTARVSKIEEGRGKPGAAPIGRAIANAEVYILDQELELAPVGVRGELYIAGRGVARGYRGRPEITGEKFIPSRFSSNSGERLYRTGDLCRYLADGNIEFIGRVDEQVKIRGYRIELGEIEARLTDHPAVRDAVVVVRENSSDDKALVAYHTGAEVRAEELRGHLSSSLPEYMVPAAYVHLERLPLTANGKLDRRALPAPNAWNAGERGSYFAPQTPVEEIVVGIFEEVLKLDRVGRRDNFFELGGHSLLATQVISRVRKAFEVEVGVKRMFENATVEGLARVIEEAMRAGERDDAPPLVRVSREERLPLSFAQQRLWFIDQLEPGNAVYNCPEAVKLTGKLNLEVLERVINEILRRHEVLRTRINVVEGEPAQVIDEWEPRTLPVEDLTSLTPEEKEETSYRLAAEDAATGFDLRRGPLLRMKVLKLGEEEHVALFTMHHIVSDGWSMGILIGEVKALYEAYCAGEESPLEELPIQYADFAVWQRSWIRGEALEKQLSYWRRQLGGKLPVLELPTDKPRPVRPTHRGAQHSHMLSTTLSSSLKALSLRQNCTLFMTLLAAFKILLYHLTGQTDISVGTDIANRNRAETERLIGMFVNQLVLRTELPCNSTFEELLRKVRESTLGAYAYQDLPFEKLVEALNPKRDANSTPLFQVKMALQNAPPKELSLPGLILSPIGIMGVPAKFDLLLNLHDTERGISASLQYNTDLFEESAPRRILNRFHTLLDRIVERPDAKLQEFIEALIEADQAEQLEKERELGRVRLSTLKSIKRKAIGET